jgi:hypothetical protein
MTMGNTGMGDMGEMGMPVPKNSIPMLGGEGQFGYIAMGGMFTVFKVREGISSYADPGWYKHPEGTVADVATDEELKRDDVELPKGLPPSAARSMPNDEAWCGAPPAKSPLLARNEATARVKLQ